LFSRAGVWVFEKQRKRLKLIVYLRNKSDSISLLDSIHCDGLYMILSGQDGNLDVDEIVTRDVGFRYREIVFAPPL